MLTLKFVFTLDNKYHTDLIKVTRKNVIFLNFTKCSLLYILSLLRGTEQFFIF